MKKKYISLFLALVMVIGLAVPTTLAAETGLYDDLMATGHIVEFESAYNSANAEAKNALTTQQITGIYNYLNDLYIDPSAASLLAKRDSLNSAILALPNAPELCSECGTLGGHTGGCALTPTPAPTQEPTPTPEVTEPTPTPEAGEPTPEPTPEVTPEPVPTTYETLMAAADLETLYNDLFTIVGADAEQLYSLTAEELAALTARTEELYAAIETPTDMDEESYTMLMEMWVIAAMCPDCGLENGEHEEDCPRVLGAILVDEWNGTQTSGTFSVSSSKSLTGTVNITGTLTLRIGETATGDVKITRAFANDTANAPMFHVSGNGKLVIEGSADKRIVLDGGNTFKLRAMDANKDAVATRSGAAIYLNDGNIDLDYVTIQNMFTDRATGKTYSYSSGGAAIYVVGRTSTTAGTYNDDNLQLTNVTVDNCLDRSGNSIIYIFGYVDMNGCKIINCAEDYFYGGVIKGGGATNFCKLNMTNCEAYNNYSSGWGGVILWACGGNNSKATLTGCTFDYNKAEYLGGAISVEGTLEMVNCKIRNNVAMSGGGIATFPFTVATGAETNNACGLIMGSGNEISNNSSTATEAFTPFKDLIEKNADGEPTGTVAPSYPAGGGGIWCYMFQPPRTETLWDCALTIGAGNVIKENDSAALGGGVALMKKDGGTATLTIDGADINQNEAPNGAGVAVTGGNLIMSAGSIHNHTTTGNGAGAYVNGGSFTMTGGTIGGSGESDANTAANGGGAYVTGGSMQMTGGTITGNKATTNGGGVAVDGGSFTMISGNLTGNTGGTYGGGAYAKGGDIIIGVNGCDGPGTNGEDHNHTVAPTDKTHPVVKNNNAPFGGGLAVQSTTTPCKVYLYCGTITGNTSMNEGTGANVFMSGNGNIDETSGSQIQHHLESTVIGKQEADGWNHGIVVIGGLLHVVTDAETTKITIKYHPNYAENTEPWVGIAPENYRLNLPYCPTGWETAQNTKDLTFVGWTYDPTPMDNTGIGDLSYIRDKDDYKFLGEPITVKELSWIQANKPAGNEWIDFYAVWAPRTNTITYAAARQDWGTDAYLSTEYGNEAKWTATTHDFTGYDTVSYSFSPTAGKTPLMVPAPVKPGYTFVGWRLNADTSRISNWGSDAPNGYSIYPTSSNSGTDNADNTWSYSTDKTLTINMDRNFGYITLTALFVEDEVVFTYTPIGPDDLSGTLAGETAAWQTVTQKMGAATGVPAPVFAEPGYGYKFMGWGTEYSSADNKYTVTTGVDGKATTAEAADGKVSITPGRNSKQLYESTTFYAVFDYNLADLKITKTVTTANGLTNDYADEQLFVFQVKDDTGKVISTITLAAGQSKVINDLYIGRTYTVTELTNWSWRYNLTSDNDVEVPIRPDPENTREVNVASFNNELQTNQWLTEDSTVVNTFGAKQ